MVTEEEEAPEAEYFVEEDVEALIAGEELSEEFQEKHVPFLKLLSRPRLLTVQEELKAIRSISRRRSCQSSLS